MIYVQNSGRVPAVQPVNINPNDTATATPTATAQCGNALVSGNYGTSLTIATENDIIVNGDIKHADSDDVMLGLIANGFVRVRHNVTWNGPAPTATTTRPARSTVRSMPPS